MGILNYIVAAARQGIDSHLVTAIDEADSALGADLRGRASAEDYRITLLKRTGHFEGRARHWGISLPLAVWLSRHSADFDVIMMHGAWMFSTLSALFFGKLNGKVCILVPHESLTEFDVHKKGSRARVMAKKFLKRVYSRYCNLILFMSHGEESESVRPDAKAKYMVIRYPLVDDRGPVRFARRMAAQSSLRVGFLGRIDPKKNIDVLLRATALLPAQFSLVIGGEGPEKLKQSLVTLARELGIEDRVEWRGFVSVPGKDDFFQSIDVLVMPSQFESFGIVAVESMMRGVPVIVSPTTGVSELVGEFGGGLVVPPEPEAVSAALRNLAGDQKRMEALSAQALVAAGEHLSFSRIGLQLKQKYLELTDGSRREAYDRTP